MLKNIIYLSNSSSKNVYQALIEKDKKFVSSQSQKFNNLLALGLCKNNLKVYQVSGLFVNSRNRQIFFKKRIEIADEIEYHYLPFINLPLIRALCLFFYLRKELTTIFRQNHLKVFETAIVCDALNFSIAFSGSLWGKKRGLKVLSVVTDLPKFLPQTKAYTLRAKISFRLKAWVSNKIFKKSAGFIFLAQAMNPEINATNKPYVVIEGIVDEYLPQIPNVQENDECTKKIVLYAGFLDSRYGVESMVNAFVRAKCPDCELHIYGAGPLSSFFEQKKLNYPSIKYFGIRNNSFIIQAEKRATLLVNPRFPDEDFAKYSFPSKNLEYLASGTPMVGFFLQGMPKEYCDLMYCFEGQTIEEMAKTFSNILSKSGEELEAQGRKAQRYVLEYKGAEKQGRKIVDLLNLIV